MTESSLRPRRRGLASSTNAYSVSRPNSGSIPCLLANGLDVVLLGELLGLSRQGLTDHVRADVAQAPSDAKERIRYPSGGHRSGVRVRSQSLALTELFVHGFVLRSDQWCAGTSGSDPCSFRLSAPRTALNLVPSPNTAAKSRFPQRLGSSRSTVTRLVPRPFAKAPGRSSVTESQSTRWMSTPASCPRSSIARPHARVSSGGSRRRCSIR